MRRLAIPIALASLAIAILAVPPQRSVGPPLRDFEAYYAAGETWHYGGDPYGRDVWRTEKDVPGVVASRDELLPFVGPPFGLPLWSVLARLPWHAASIVWAAILGLAAATIVLGSLLVGRGRLRPLDAVAAVALAAAFAPLTGGIALGQVAIVSCAAIVAMPLALRPRRTLAAAALALVAALQPNLAIVLVARLAEARTWLAFGCAALFAAGASALTLGGAGAFTRYAGVLAAQGVAERFNAIQTTPGAVARALGASAAVADAVAATIAFACVVGLIVQAARRRHPPAIRLALACALVPLALPFAHEHDFTLAFFPALLLVLRARGAAWIAGAVATVALGVDWLGLAQRPTGLAATVAFALAAACAVAALAREPLRPYHAAPLLVVPGVALVGTIALGHPLPTWPDALAPTYRAALDATAADVWREEQFRSGIAALDPVWGALRAIPLVACVAIWLAASRSLGPAALGADAR
ncbi:MAG: hypothetical protein NVSMB19_21230 [Vulcanimicrobiaceae bacterium]